VSESGAKFYSPWFYLICRAKALCGKEAFSADLIIRCCLFFLDAHEIAALSLCFFFIKKKEEGLRGHSGASQARRMNRTTGVASAS
jgi:hypothetical protein